MTFHKGSIKLAGLYLAIMMGISLFFSVNIYQLTVQEIDRGFRRIGVAVTGEPGGPSGPVTTFSTGLRDQVVQVREQEYSDAKVRVVNRLLVINLLILLGGGVLSYYLAVRTLRPIEEAHDAQSRFTADASHELRTPITAMRSENEVALMDPKLTLTKAKTQLRSNIEELDKLTNLATGLLRLARVNNNHLEKADVKVEDVVNQAIERVLPAAEAKHILLNNSAQTEAVVLGDAGSLAEVLVIILDNAVKYSPEKTEVQVLAKTSQKYITVQVIDQGIGIKATELAHIFDRFYRADSSRSKNQIEGYGLGLAIAKNIVENHDGTLTATSVPSKGSVFSVSLPLKT